MDIIKLLSIDEKDKHKWVKYYKLETYKYYDYIINIIPNNQNILHRAAINLNEILRNAQQNQSAYQRKDKLQFKQWSPAPS